MTKIFITPIRPAILPTDPAGKIGAFYYNVEESNFRFYNGSDWQSFGTGTGGGGGVGSGTVLIIDGGFSNSTYGTGYGNILASLDGGSAI